MILTCFHTRLGWIAILAEHQSLIAMTLPRSTRILALDELRTAFKCNPPLGESALLQRTRRKLESYFAGRRVIFDNLPVDDSHGTAFQRRVWQLTRAIPYGTTRTYQELAQSAGRPRAARAIGQCMAKNPLPIIIPCHRVVGSTGSLRGFGGGLPLKRALLEMEGAL
jgi:methylated-DNA-[protein]-cysteine S-methyltransferase